MHPITKESIKKDKKEEGQSIITLIKFHSTIPKSTIVRDFGMVINIHLWCKL